MDLIKFIAKAKLSGYASAGEGQKIKFNDGSIGFQFISEGYRYLDRYNGFNPFAGFEQIYNSNNKLLWVMNYYGEILPKCTEAKKIYSFLKKAMLLISPEYPFRGPPKLESQNLKYENMQKGSIERFNGVENIYENDEKVYVLQYHSGKIKTDM